MTTALAADPRRRLQRRTLLIISLAQIVSGIGTGAVVSTGALLAVELSGSDALAGSVTTTMTLGAAIASALLMRLALARGRRVSLALGLLVAALGAIGIIVAAVLGSFWLLIAAGVLIGFGTSVNLQARFAATDLSAADRQGRDLSLVVWMSTVGSVAGPNLLGIGEAIAPAFGIPGLAGVFVITTCGMLAGMLIIWFGVRPDPYLVLIGRERIPGETAPAVDAQRRQSPPPRTGFRDGFRALGAHTDTRIGIIGLVVAHAVMVGVMSVTPVHLTGHGASIIIVGVTVSLHVAGMFALSPVMGMLADRVGGRVVTGAGLLVLALSVVLAGYSGAQHWVTILGLVLLGLGWSAASVASSAMIVAATAVHERVAAQGVSDTLMSLAGAGGGLLAGVALATVGYAGLGVAAAVVALVALGAMVWMGRSRVAS